MNAQEYVDDVLTRMDALTEMNYIPRIIAGDPITRQLLDTKNGVNSLYELHTALCTAYYLSCNQKYAIKNYDVLCYCLQIKAELDKNDSFRMFLLNEIIAITSRDNLRNAAIQIKDYLERKAQEDKFYGLDSSALSFFTNPNDFNTFWSVSKARQSSKEFHICSINENSVEIMINTISDTTDGMFEFVDFSTEDSSIKLLFTDINKILVTRYTLSDIPNYGAIHDYRIVKKNDCILFEVSDNWLNGERRIGFCVEAKKVTCSELKISQL